MEAPPSAAPSNVSGPLDPEPVSDEDAPSDRSSVRAAILAIGATARARARAIRESAAEDASHSQLGRTDAATTAHTLADLRPAAPELRARRLAALGLSGSVPGPPCHATSYPGTPPGDGMLSAAAEGCVGADVSSPLPGRAPSPDGYTTPVRPPIPTGYFEQLLPTASPVGDWELARAVAAA